MATRLGSALAVRVARGLYRRWEALSPGERERLAALARDVKERALELRGSANPEPAERDLEQASRELADAIGDAAAADPEAEPAEVAALRAELALELERMQQRQRDAA